MTSEIQKANPQPQLPTSPTKFMTQNGNYNTQIANVQNCYIQSLIIVSPEKTGAGTIDANKKIDCRYYNLFVQEDGNYDGSSFVVKKELAFTTCMSKTLCYQYGSFSSAAIERLESYPAIFAGQNHRARKTDAKHSAFFGLVIKVGVLNDGIRVSYLPIRPFPQQLLNENLDLFGLNGVWGRNELDTVHWAIKNVNLIEALTKIGINPLVPTHTL